MINRKAITEDEMLPVTMEYDNGVASLIPTFRLKAGDRDDKESWKDLLEFIETNEDIAMGDYSHDLERFPFYQQGFQRALSLVRLWLDVSN